MSFCWFLSFYIRSVSFPGFEALLFLRFMCFGFVDFNPSYRFACETAGVAAMRPVEVVDPNLLFVVNY